MHRPFGRSVSKTQLQILGAIALLLFSAFSFLIGLFWHPLVPFIYERPGASWITNPRPVSTGVFIVQDRSGPVASFSRDFTLPAATREVAIEVRALGELALSLNGQEIGRSDGHNGCLKSTCRFPAGAALVPGRNEIRAEVMNPVGPPLLRLRLAGEGIALATDTDWRVSMDDEPPARAIRADDTRRYPDALAGPTPADALRDRAGALFALFVASAGVFLAGRRFAPERLLRHLPVAGLAFAALFWLGLFLAKFREIPLRFGFDGPSHARYVRYLVEHQALPLATEGVSFYQPPLYYLCSAGLLSLFDPATGSALERGLLKLLPFVSGLGIVVVSWALCRRILPHDPACSFFAVAIAAVLPLNLSMSAYVSNEPFFALLASLSLLAAVRILLSPAPSLGSFALLSLLLG